MTAKTLYDKLFDAHLVAVRPDGQSLLYCDLHLVHEVTSPQAFADLKRRGLPLWRRENILAMPDHNISTKTEERHDLNAMTPMSRQQVQRLRDNAAEHGLQLLDLDDVRQGIVHIVGPEQGATLPGFTVVCGDSHTSTHGALATLAMGIGTSQVAHVLATQCVLTHRLGNMRAQFTGAMPKGVAAKDLILRLIAEIGTGGATGYALELAGPVIRTMNMEGRMTMCNMGVEAGARATLIAYDAVTEAYVAGKPGAPKGDRLERAQADWQGLHSDTDAAFDATHSLEVTDMAPYVSWGTSPEQAVPIDGEIPTLAQAGNAAERSGFAAAYDYMGVQPGQQLADVAIDKVFIGSCTNGRIDDLRAAAHVLLNRRVRAGVQMFVVPGSGVVRQQAEAEGLDKIFTGAGAEWREAGCSMCLAMNNDRLQPGERCASTSNRNFEGRQGYGGRTHLVSPATAAAAAVTGRLVDVREMI